MYPSSKAINIPGELTIGTVKELVPSVIDSIKSSNSTSFDFSNVQKIDATGIQLIISLKKTIADQTRIVLNKNISDTMLRIGIE